MIVPWRSKSMEVRSAQRFGDDTRTILKVLDVCTFLKGFQGDSFVWIPVSQKMGEPAMAGPPIMNYRLATFDACRPLGPEVTSNSTAWPSFSDLYPSPWIEEKWTKTSSPDWRWMNPKPLLALNHFTVPCSFTAFSFLFELFGASRLP